MADVETAASLRPERRLRAIRGEDTCFTMSVVDEFDLVAACRRHLRRAYPEALLVLLADTGPAALERLLAAADRRTRVVATEPHLYAVQNGGLVVSSHLAAFLRTDASWWFKIDPDTFVRRPLCEPVSEGCFFGTIQTQEPRPSLQGGCIGGDRRAVERMFYSGVLQSPRLLRYEESWAEHNPTVLKRARAGLVSFDFVHAWGCEEANIPIMNHPEIKSYWLGPPRPGRRYAITHPHKNLGMLDLEAPDELSPVAEELRRVLRLTVPHDAVVAVISRGDDALLELEGREAWHFPRHERGTYLGHHPADSQEALGHLDAARRDGAQFLIIPEPSLWWLRHYREFGRHLHQHCRRVISREGCVIYDLA